MTDKNHGRERLMGLAALLALTLLGVAYVEKERISMLFLETHRQPEVKYRTAPPEIRAFLLQARAADAIEDPLARCLAFPDIPGNQWPKDMARMRCYSKFEPHITHSDIVSHVERGAVKELDALFQRDLDRHFSTRDFSEAIHADFYGIVAEETSDAMTRRWLELDPESPFALMARARFFRQLAEAARGDEMPGTKAPKERVPLMTESVARALELLSKVVKIEPRLMPAYRDMIVIGTVYGRPDIVAFAESQAFTQDPTCEPVDDVMMTMREPDLGGSREAMSSLAERISPGVSRKPLLALIVVEPVRDEAYERYQKRDLEGVMTLLAPIVRQTVSGFAFQDYARAMIESNHFKWRWEILVYLLEESRFERLKDWAISDLGTDLALNASDVEWSISVLERGLIYDPDNAFAHLALGQSYVFANQPLYAERQFRLAMRDPVVRPQASAELDRMMHSKDGP